jgi:DNA-binding beta-propeller fold protein YncE
LSYFIIEGTSSIFAGLNAESGNGDGVGKNARFQKPHGIAIDQQTGTLFVSDYLNNSIRKITPQGKFFLLICTMIE